MPSLWERLFGRPAERESSAQAAKRRLQFVLVHDRINLPPDIMAAMKQEILDVISKYVQVSEDAIDIALHPSEGGSLNRLVAEVPFTKSIVAPPPPLDEDSDLEAPAQAPEEVDPPEAR
ncbi:MAG: cell division topological specificity factor MinE [Anaerolineae bacterium]|jgi:cell division topological specificity factor|nr:cell division topological specificity factor MinE [Anaerolineae bacterium]